MSESEIRNKLIAILTDYSTASADEIRDDSRLSGDLGLASLDLLNMLSRFEDEFNISIDDRNLPDFQTISDILIFLKKQLTN
ncbi:MAG: acyl carrier protein [Clostridiales bacterium]|nr:acyl carrier protein [Clostridiales bacterium]